VKIYTKRGDTGQTDLYGAGRVDKDDPRVEAYGTVDECNAALGVAAEALSRDPRTHAIQAIVLRLQHELFCVGSELAAPGMVDKMPLVGTAHIEAMEKEIDDATAVLPALKRFILPGGSAAAAALHVARTIARRAERLVTPLARDSQCRPLVVMYLNRSSDHLFTLARLSNHALGISETEWEGRT
jgi:cob(I)alamin adenosyltransferase